MEIIVSVHTYNSYGGNPSISRVGGYLEMDVPNFGEAINKFDIHVYFQQAEKVKENLSSLFINYETFTKSLPKTVFYKKKRKIEILFISKLGDSSLVSGYGPPNMNLFKDACHEIVNELNIIKDKIRKSDDFNVENFLLYIKEKALRLPVIESEFQDLLEKIDKFRQLKFELMDAWEKLGIDWEEFHPISKEILDHPFYWDSANDFSPNGNDTGADVLELYREWKTENKENSGFDFFAKLMQDWEVSSPPSVDDDFSFYTYTEALIGLAFAQIKLHGKIEEKIKNQALIAIEMLKSIKKEKYIEEKIYNEHQEILKMLELKLVKM